MKKSTGATQEIMIRDPKETYGPTRYSKSRPAEKEKLNREDKAPRTES